MPEEQLPSSPGWGSFAAGILVGGGIAAGTAYFGYKLCASKDGQREEPSTSGRSPEPTHGLSQRWTNHHFTCLKSAKLASFVILRVRTAGRTRSPNSGANRVNALGEARHSRHSDAREKSPFKVCFLVHVLCTYSQDCISLAPYIHNTFALQPSMENGWHSHDPSRPVSLAEPKLSSLLHVMVGTEEVSKQDSMRHSRVPHPYTGPSDRSNQAAKDFVRDSGKVSGSVQLLTGTSSLLAVCHLACQVAQSPADEILVGKSRKQFPGEEQEVKRGSLLRRRLTHRVAARRANIPAMWACPSPRLPTTWALQTTWPWRDR